MVNSLQMWNGLIKVDVIIAPKVILLYMTYVTQQPDSAHMFWYCSKLAGLWAMFETLSETLVYWFPT